MSIDAELDEVDDAGLVVVDGHHGSQSYSEPDADDDRFAAEVPIAHGDVLNPEPVPDVVARHHPRRSRTLQLGALGPAPGGELKLDRAQTRAAR